MKVKFSKPKDLKAFMLEILLGAIGYLFLINVKECNSVLLGFIVSVLGIVLMNISITIKK